MQPSTTPTSPAGVASRAPHVPGEAGVWVVILGEMTMFAAFFAVYTHERTASRDLFTASQRQLDGTIGLINTCLLLLSSLLVLQGVKAVRRGSAHGGSRLFALAIACGIGFAVNKAIEYADLLHAGHTPATNHFFMYFFVFTGIHACHLAIGICLLTYLWWTTRRPDGRVSTAVVEGCASYWHLVDVLWIVLFPLLYLT
jgi:nitric oxide reductase NorE protein